MNETKISETELVAAEQAAFFDPDKNGISDPTTTRIVQLVEEMSRLRASARHWQARALIAEPQAKRADELQRRLNEKLGEESAAKLNGKAGKVESTP